MASSTSNSLKAIGTGIIIVLLTIGLSLFMITDAFQPKSTNAAAMVGKKDISLAEFKRVFDQRLQAHNRDNNTRMTATQAYNQGFADQILQNLITRTAMSVDADDLGVGVDNSAIVNELSQYPVFKDEFTGKFDQAKLNTYLQRERQTRKDFETSMISDLKIQQITEPVISGIKAPLDYASQRYKFITEQRKVSVLTLGPAAVSKPEIPSDELLQAFIDENAVNYTAPEYRAFTMLRIELTDMNPDVKVKEDDVRALYEFKLKSNKLGSPETRSVIILNATNETLANDALASLKAGKTADQVVTDLGFVEPTLYEETLEDDILDSKAGAAAFAGKDGDIIAVEGALSWYVVQITGITPAITPNYTDLKEELETEVKADQAEQIMYDLADAVETSISDGLTLEQISNKIYEIDLNKNTSGLDSSDENENARIIKVGASVSSVGLISRLGETPEGLKLGGVATITGVAEDEKIMTQIFTNDVDYESDFFETSKGGFGVIRVEEIVDSRKRELDEVKSQATAAWTAKQYDTALSDLTRDLSQRARDGETLSEIKASLPDGTFLQDVIMVRSSRTDGVSPVVASRIFDARKGEVVQGDGPSGLTRNIAIVNDIIANTDGLAGGYAEAMQIQSSNELSGDIQQAYRAAILKENQVLRYEDKIKAQLGITE